VREILFAGEEPNEWTSDVRLVISNSPAKYWMRCLQRIQYGALRHLSLDINLDFALDVRKCPKPLRQYDPDHGNVCTSTDMTDGRSRTIGVQVSPLSGET
jgi:hypothetical protein